VPQKPQQNHSALAAGASWKSGASAPRKAPIEINAGFSRCGPRPRSFSENLGASRLPPCFFVHALVVPTTLRKVREEWDTHRIIAAPRNQRLRHPPTYSLRQ
jgi:hypothetical protein